MGRNVHRVTGEKEALENSLMFERMLSTFNDWSSALFCHGLLKLRL